MRRRSVVIVGEGKKARRKKEREKKTKETSRSGMVSDFMKGNYRAGVDLPTAAAR